MQNDAAVYQSSACDAQGPRFEFECKKLIPGIGVLGTNLFDSLAAAASYQAPVSKVRDAL